MGTGNKDTIERNQMTIVKAVITLVEAARPYVRSSLEDRSEPRNIALWHYIAAFPDVNLTIPKGTYPTAGHLCKPTSNGFSDYFWQKSVTSRVQWFCDILQLQYPEKKSRQVLQGAANQRGLFLRLVNESPPTSIKLDNPVIRLAYDSRAKYMKNKELAKRYEGIKYEVKDLEGKTVLAPMKITLPVLVPTLGPMEKFLKEMAPQMALYSVHQVGGKYRLGAPLPPTHPLIVSSASSASPKKMPVSPLSAKRGLENSNAIFPRSKRMKVMHV